MLFMHRKIDFEGWKFESLLIGDDKNLIMNIL
jgi:hypothetical protein